ncbi:MAG: hypothetical protein ACK5HS_05370 [Mycoplasmatales bacterium]
MIRGESLELPVYKMHIDVLKYNQNNDRITTEKLKLGIELEEEKIGKLIEQQDSAKFKKTRKSIKRHGQLKDAVVTNDGIVVDGNRRFTCLKQLYAETKEDKYFYFLASVLDGKLNKKEIKKLELNLQHAEEEKVKYNTIDLLVGIYNEVCKEKTLLWMNIKN